MILGAVQGFLAGGQVLSHVDDDLSLAIGRGQNGASHVAVLDHFPNIGDTVDAVHNRTVAVVKRTGGLQGLDSAHSHGVVVAQDSFDLITELNVPGVHDVLALVRAPVAVLDVQLQLLFLLERLSLKGQRCAGNRLAERKVHEVFLLVSHLQLGQIHHLPHQHTHPLRLGLDVAEPLVFPDRRTPPAFPWRNPGENTANSHTSRLPCPFAAHSPAGSVRPLLYSCPCRPAGSACRRNSQSTENGRW